MKFAVRRLLQLVPVLLIVTFLTFLLLNLLPGDPAVLAAGPGANEAQVEEVRRDLGLDKPVLVGYVSWLAGAVQGDLGESYATRLEVRDYLGNRLPLTLQLMAYSIVLALAVAIPVGVLAAYRANSIFDRIANTTAFGMLSVPNFIVAVILIYVFAIRTQVFPATWPRVEFADEPARFMRAMFLPAVSLALGQIAVFMRLLRTDMIATLQEDFIGTAKAKGLPTTTILFRHALRPSTLSLLTVAGISIGQLIGGTVIVEFIFTMPGMGSAIVTAIFQRDYMVVLGGVVIIAVGFVIVNFLVDLFYAVLDPRIRHAR